MQSKMKADSAYIVGKMVDAEISVAEAAAKAGISKAAMSRVLRGDASVRIVTAGKLRRVFGDPAAKFV